MSDGARDDSLTASTAAGETGDGVWHGRDTDPFLSSARAPSPGSLPVGSGSGSGSDDGDGNGDDDNGEDGSHDSGMRLPSRSNRAERANFTLGWCVWTVASSISIVSSRYILLVENYHYPLHLLLVHLLVAALGSTCRTVRYRGGPSVAFSAPGWAIIWKSRKYRGPFEILGIACTAISLPMAVQAVTHFWSVTTLAMICMVGIPLEAICVRLLARSAPTAGTAGVTLVSLLAGAALLGDDYRLTVNGLVFGLLAVILLAAAKAFFDYDHLRNDANDSKSGPNFTFQSIVWAAFLLTAGWTLPVEGFWGPIVDLKRVNYFLLILNVISSAAAIVTGGGPLCRLPVHMPSRGRTVSVRVHILFAAAALVCMTALCAAFTLVFVGRSYTSILQLLAYMLLAVTAGLTALRNYDEIQQDYPDSSTHEMLLRSEDGLRENVSLGRSAKVGWHPDRFRDHIGGTHAEKVSLCTLLAAAVCASGWMLSNFGFISTPTVQPNPVPRLDVNYSPDTDLDIVVNLYKEPLSHITDIVAVLKEASVFPQHSHRLIIYTKNEDADVDDIKKVTGAYNVTKLPNVGREGETYLRHIIERWDSLAKHTMFLQADVHNVREFRPRFRDYFDPARTGMLSLGFSGVPCDCNDCGDRWGWHDDTKLVPRLYSDVYGETDTCTRALLSYKGQFLASAERIRGVKKDVYADLWKAFVDPESWAHQPDYLRGNEDKMSAPYFGYAVERLWSILMQCSDLNIAWRCPTLLSRNRRGGSKGDCQCFDSVEE